MTREERCTLQALRTVARSPTMFGAKRIIADAVELIERQANEKEILSAKVADLYSVIELVGTNET